MLRPILITPPASTPVSLAEAKAHLRVDSTDEDDLITSLIGAATGYLDGYAGILGRCLMEQVWRQDYEAFVRLDAPPISLPSHIGFSLRLPFPEVASVTVKYYDTNNVQQTVNSSAYEVLDDELGSIVAFVYTFVAPNTYFRPDAVSVALTVGASDAADVPAALKHAILLLVGDWYASRETMQAGRIAALPFAVDALIAPYRRVGV